MLLEIFRDKLAFGATWLKELELNLQLKKGVPLN